MADMQTHPRRRPLKAQDTPSSHAMHLRKGNTFNAGRSLSPDLVDLANHQHTPRRSLTNSAHLEELVHDASVQRIADVLKAFDKRVAGHKQSPASILADREVLPLPSFLLDNTSMNSGPMDIDTKTPAVARTPHNHASDSGLGSSISGSKHGKTKCHPVLRTPQSNIHKGGQQSASSARGSISTSVTSTHSAITRSFSAIGAAEEKHTLGEYACRQIHDHIIKPILAEEELKDFHPLIKDVPRRIGEKNISNLRDLEKTLVFLAPVSGIRYLSESAKAHCILRGFKEFSATPTSYLRFCERSIQLLIATVDRLSEQDQRLPTDRPYTNNYFLDLIEQIRRYAAIMAATRQKEANNEDLDEMDYSPYDLTSLARLKTILTETSGEKITLRGGLSHNGRPVELVREKDGKVIPLAEGADDIDTGFSSKRTLSDDETDDEGVKRSMARRRKSDKPGDVMHQCGCCEKEFKRPCDLTKHEKTHSRPWKCTEEKCKYYEHGWPTEKERDRHVNDKHSAAPPQYKCMYSPCTYASKRESNCKQHMEKAHGWEYVRSKSNGRKKASAGNNDHSPLTPLTPFLATPGSAMTTPVTPFLASPSVPFISDFNYPYGFNTPALSAQGLQDEFRRDSITTDGSAFTYSSGHSPMEPSSFENAVTPEDTTINHNDIFNYGINNGNNINFTPAFQQPTPAMSTGYENFDNMTFPMNAASGGLHLSPGAHPDVTLFSPQMNIDEGFSEGGAFDRPMGDFTLFENAQASNVNLDTTAGFFPDLSNFGGQFPDTLFTDATMQNTFDDLWSHPGNSM
jgi:hypothetical protein